MESRKVSHALGPEPDRKKRLRVVTLYIEKGLGCADIAREIGVSRQAVRQMLIRSGVVIRPRWPGRDSNRG